MGKKHYLGLLFFPLLLPQPQFHLDLGPSAQQTLPYTLELEPPENTNTERQSLIPRASAALLHLLKLSQWTALTAHCCPRLC